MAIFSISIRKPTRSRSSEMAPALLRWPANWDPLDLPNMEFLQKASAGGLSVKLVCKAGEGVLARLGRVNGEFTWSLRVPASLSLRRISYNGGCSECNIPFWPHGFVTAHCDIEALLQNWTNEYACLGYGKDLYPALVDFCELTGIRSILV